MAIIKKISVFDGSSWSDDNIGADASNISLNSSVTLNQVLLDKLTGGQALVTNGSGVITTSSVTSAELEKLSGVTSPIQTQLDDKVSKLGDTMTGALTIKSSNLAHGTVPSSEVYGTRLYFTGSDDEVFGQLRATSYPSGLDGMQLLTYRNVNGSNVFNILTIGLTDDGTKFVSFSESTPWRTALGIQNTISSKTSSSTVSLSANTWKGVNSLTLTPGVYIITAGCTFPSAVTSGTVAVHIGTTNNSEGIIDRSAQINVPANAGSATTNLSCAAIYRCTANTTIYENVYSNTACTLAANASGLYAYKIIPN